jgi:hypothetical protein
METKLVGVDVGGTFTDLILLDETSGEVQIAKVLTTPGNQAGGVLAALGQTGVTAGELKVLVHGTTTATNALLERKVATAGLITTRGFRDVLELGRRTRPRPYGLKGSFEPLIPRDLRLEVSERIDAEGEIVVPLDEDEVRQAARRLRERGVEALVVHFLHSYVNDRHEARAREVAAAEWPNAYITVGSELLPEYREYESRDDGRDQAYRSPHLSKDEDIRVVAGDLVTVRTPGGDGYGDPLERDPELVRRDVVRGYCTAEDAARDYGVVLDDAARELDPDATRALRARRWESLRSA